VTTPARVNVQSHYGNQPAVCAVSRTSPASPRCGQADRRGLYSEGRDNFWQPRFRSDLQVDDFISVLGELLAPPA